MALPELSDPWELPETVEQRETVKASILHRINHLATYLLSKDLHSFFACQGFYDDDRQAPPHLAMQASIARMHSELSEALEAIRHDNPVCLKAPEISSLEEEMADLAIRLLDFCGAYNIDLAHAMYVKMQINFNRPFKHGKNS